MTIAAMVHAVQRVTGVSRHVARELVSDGAERLDYATDTHGYNEDGTPAYDDDDVVEYAIRCYEDQLEGQGLYERVSLPWSDGWCIAFVGRCILPCAT